MDCCPCSETADERYARWDREASEAKAAALAHPNTWVAVGEVDDEGDVGGDVQAGPAWARKFVQWIPEIGMWGVIYDAYYVAIRDEPDSEGQEVAWVENQTETMLCRDPDDPGSTEEWSDYTYAACDDPTIVGHDELNAYARKLAEGTTMEDFGEFPADIVSRYAS